MVSEIMVQFVNVNVFDSYLSTYLAEWAIQTKKLSPLLSIYSILKLSVLESMDWPGIADAAHLSRVRFQVIFKSKQFHIIQIVREKENECNRNCKVSYDDLEIPIHHMVKLGSELKIPTYGHPFSFVVDMYYICWLSFPTNLSIYICLGISKYKFISNVFHI